jgi:succinate dehydrogenase / fumarate reductase membrane anchor subunit
MKTVKLGPQNRPKKLALHWRWQRITAWLLLPLSLWLMTNFALYFNDSYETVRAWASTALVSTLLILTLVLLLFHAHLGLLVIIDDYFRGQEKKLLERVLNLIFFLGCMTSIVSVSIVYLGN